jgi:hypothetical protein
MLPLRPQKKAFRQPPRNAAPSRPTVAQGVIAGHLARAGTRQVDWRPDQEDDSLASVRCPNLLAEFERFPRGVSANVEQHEIVDIELPEKSRVGNLFSFMHLDSVTSQNGSARFARSLAAVDEKNFLLGEKPAATKWWAIHTTPPKCARLRKVIRPKSAPRRGGSQERNRKAPMASRGFRFSRDSGTDG